MKLTLDMIAKDAAEKALDEITYKEKTIREWVEIIAKQQPCEDCISRQAVLDKKELVELEDGQSFYCINPEDVETLLPVTPQPCDDCVSREAVEKITWEEPSYDDALNVLTEVRDKVKALPPVKPQRPKGEWIVLREEYEFMGSIVNEPRGCKCSNCNKVVRFKSDFCPNCGADMRESEGEDETDN